MDFNPTDVFRIAVRIEDIGFYFYKKAADHTLKDGNVSDVLASLAETEKKHYFTFMKMEKAAAKEPFGDTSALTSCIGQKFGPAFFSEDLAAKIGNGVDSVLDILKLALDKENESVEYYAILRDAVAKDETKKTIDLIIEQEKIHVQTVQNQIARLTHKEGKTHEKH